MHIPPLTSDCTEEYEVTVEYEGKRSYVSRGRPNARAPQRDGVRRRAKLQILDTAGVEQFTGINETCIEVSTSPRSQSGCSKN